MQIQPQTPTPPAGGNIENRQPPSPPSKPTEESEVSSKNQESSEKESIITKDHINLYA